MFFFLERLEAYLHRASFPSRVLASHDRLRVSSSFSNVDLSSVFLYELEFRVGSNFSPSSGLEFRLLLRPYESWPLEPF